MRTVQTLLNDDSGFIVSAELVLIATLLVIGLIVGMSQVQHAVNEELNDVAHAIGALNQSYFFTGFQSRKGNSWAKKAQFFGSSFKDNRDACDGGGDGCDISCGPIGAECAHLYY